MTTVRKIPLWGMLIATPLGVAAQSSVTLYGRLDVSANYQRFDSVPARAGAHISSVSSDASLWGLRGLEDLGGGNRAYFKLEAGVQLDTGASTSTTSFFNRETFVGLGSKTFGSVQLGSMYSPTIGISGRVDPFGRLNIGTHSNPMMQGGSRGYVGVQNNAVGYISPTFSGFTAKANYALAENTTGRQYSIAGEYSSGPLYVGTTYDVFRITSASVGLTGANRDSATWSIGAVYDFKVVKAHAWYQNNKVDGKNDVSAYMVGATVPIGPGEVRATYMHRSETNADGDIAALGYYYFFSKRTMVYTAVGKQRNQGTATYALNPARVEALASGYPAAGQGSKAFQIGVRHSF